LKKYLLVLLFACLANVSASAQTPPATLGDPAATRLVDAFVGALNACSNKGENEFNVGRCMGTRATILELYLAAAGRCHEGQKNSDCLEASRLRLSITKTLEDAATH